jgi:hypothetical protein
MGAEYRPLMEFPTREMPPQFALPQTLDDELLIF